MGAEECRVEKKEGSVLPEGSSQRAARGRSAQAPVGVARKLRRALHSSGLRAEALKRAAALVPEARRVASRVERALSLAGRGCAMDTVRGGSRAEWEEAEEAKARMDALNALPLLLA